MDGSWTFEWSMPASEVLSAPEWAEDESSQWSPESRWRFGSGSSAGVSERLSERESIELSVSAVELDMRRSS